MKALLIAALAALTACFTPPKGGTIRFNGAQPPKSFNAYLDTSQYSAMVFDLMYETLLEMDDETGELKGALAKKWTVSADGREFVFELDDAAKWSDGTPVTAADVKWTFDAVMDAKNDTGPWKTMLAMFESPEILADGRVRFVKRGDSPRDWRDLLNCAMFWILPRHAFGEKPMSLFDFTQAVSGKAYWIYRAEPMVETELRRHGKWWRQEREDCRSLMNFDRIILRYYADNENAFEALKKRKIDVYPVYTARIFTEETGGEVFQRNFILKRRVRNHAPIGFQGFAMNMRRAPFNDVRVRRAMAYLLDRETMNRTMMNNAYFLLSSYYPDIYDEAHPCRNEFYAYDLERAKRLLAEAGYEKGFEFNFLSRGTTEDKFLALYTQALKECKIKMNIVRKDFAGWMRDVDSFNFDMTWAAWGSGTVKYPELQWSSKEADRKGSNNITGFKSAAVDRLIEGEKLLSTAAERTEAYRKIDALIAAEVPYVLLWQTDSTRLLYWNKFGMSAEPLGRYSREEAILSRWWYDIDRAEELEHAIDRNSYLPGLQYHRP